MPRLTPQHLSALKKYAESKPLTAEEKKLFPQSPETVDFNDWELFDLIELANLVEASTSIKQIKLASRETLSEPACQALASMLLKNRHIVDFDLKVETIEAENLKYLVESIPNTQLSRFAFGMRRSPESGTFNLIKLLQSLANLNTLRNLSLSFKVIESMSGALEGVLTTNANLENLHIGADIDVGATIKIAPKIAKHHGLRSFKIDGQTLGFEDTDHLLKVFIENDSLEEIRILYREIDQKKPAIKLTIDFIQERNRQFQAIKKLIGEHKFKETNAAIRDFKDFLSSFSAKLLANCDVAPEERILDAHKQMEKYLMQALINEQYQIVLQSLSKNDFASALVAFMRFEQATKLYLMEIKDPELLKRAQQEQEQQVQCLKQTFEYNLLVFEKVSKYPDVDLLKGWKAVYLSDFFAVIAEVASQEKNIKRQELLNRLLTATAMPAFLWVWLALRNDAEVRKALLKRFGTLNILVYELFLACPEIFSASHSFSAIPSLENAEREYRADLITKKRGVNNATSENLLPKKEEVKPQENTWLERIQTLAKMNFIEVTFAAQEALSILHYFPVATSASAKASSVTSVYPSAKVSPAASTSPVAKQSDLNKATAVSSVKLPKTPTKKSAAMPFWLFWTLLISGTLLGAALLLTGIGALLEPPLVFTLAAMVSVSLDIAMMPTLAIAATTMGGVLLATTFLLGALRISTSNEVQVVLEKAPADKAIKPAAKPGSDSIFNYFSNPANLFMDCFRSAPTSAPADQSAARAAQPKP